MAKARTELKFEVVEEIAVLSKNEENGWSVQLNKVAWNDKEPKYDIRAWNEDHTKMGKGITLTDAELSELAKALAELS